ncbi:MAG: flgE [Paucimonas sp.]|nr:flgE [Paucimonas sp.]
MSFQQGLSGLNAASKSLEAIGNNVANANTVGFKQSQVQFSDVYASSLTGGGTSAIGIGTKIAQVQQQFTQGNITSSNNPLDIAVNGAGFFRMSTNGTITYTRNGQFQLDKDGFIVNANGSRLTGYMVNDQGQLSTGAATDVVIDSANIEPQLTTEVEAVVNLNSSAPTIAAAFDMDDPTTYTNATSVTVYDSVGNSHVLQTFFVKTGANTFRVYGANDGAPLATPLLGTLTFGSDGQINTALTTLPFSASLTVTGTNAASPLLVDVDLGNNQWAETSTSGSALVQPPGSGSLGVLQASAVEDSNVDLTAELVNMITAQRVYQANAQTIKTQDQVLQTLVNLR